MKSLSKVTLNALKMRTLYRILEADFKITGTPIISLPGENNSAELLP